ncbi:MAG TPA: flagellar type III secretion system pore protein FliP [Clostridia bacterium]
MNIKKCLYATAILIIFLFCISNVYAEPAFPIPKIGVNVEPAQNPKDVASSIQVLVLLTVLSLAPSILIMMTSFTRIIIILSFLRNAIGTQQMPPNQVLVGLAMFLTLFIMTPVATEINDKAFQPYNSGAITQQQALDKSSELIKGFMFKYTRTSDLKLFVDLSGQKGQQVDKEKLPLTVVIPAFLISELKTAFQIGFLIYIPFLIIDMVVSSTLMSMGMMMLPPVMISLPFKILLFIMVDGWNLVAQMIVNSFAK